jgi:hypothetical protein
MQEDETVRPFAVELTLVFAALVMGLAAAAKPDPTPNWRCRVTFRDAAQDKIRSDGAGSYVDGAGGVTCYIIDEVGTVQDRWLFMSITSSRNRAPARYLRYIGQTVGGTSYPDFRNHGTFEVKGLGKVSWSPNGPSARDVMPFRAYLRHPELPFADGLGVFDGDSNIVGTFGFDGTSSVFVQPIDPCSWQVTSFTTEEPGQFAGVFGERVTATTPRVLRLHEGGKFPEAPVLRGDFPMAFEATVTVTANKPGCTS